MRVVKEAEERKKEIMDAAERLFMEKGFDGTSTNDILAAVGIARGTLYHHFPSKEHIMDGIIERLGDKILENARKAAVEKDLPVFERLVKTIMALNAGEAENIRPSEEIMEYIHQPQNALMHQKIRKLVITGVPPILAEIIKDGIEEGVFQTPWPLETMEMIVTYANTLFDEGLLDLDGEEMMGRIRAFIYNAERLLGVEEGSVPFGPELFAGGE